MDQMTQMATLMAAQLILLSIGALCYKKGYISTESRASFTHLLLNVMMPAMVFQSFKHIHIDVLKIGLQALIASFIIYTLNAFLGQLFYLDQDEGHRRLLHYATLINNVGLAGQPLASSMYGQMGTLLTSIYLIPHRIFMWSVGVQILSGQKNAEKIHIVKKLASNPNIIAVFLGIIWGFSPWELPAMIDRPLTLLGGAVSPLAALVIGSILATIDFRELFAPGVFRFTCIRLLFIPTVVLFACKTLQIDETLSGILTIMASMPAGTATALLATEYGLDDQYASKLILVSTIGCSITVPILLAFI